jgi:hypothetical protein
MLAPVTGRSSDITAAVSRLAAEGEHAAALLDTLPAGRAPDVAHIAISSTPGTGTIARLWLPRYRPSDCAHG